MLHKVCSVHSPRLEVCKKRDELMWLPVRLQIQLLRWYIMVKEHVAEVPPDGGCIALHSG